MDNTSPFLGDLDLAESLRSAVGQFVRAVRSESEAIPRARAELLGQLEREGAQTIRQLADARRVRHQGMSRAVIELEESRLVARARNDADGRGWVISLTDEGRAALHDDRSSRRDVLAARIASALDERDRAVLELVPPLLRKLAEVSPADSR